MFASLSQKNGFVFVSQSWHFKAWNQYSLAKKIQFRLLTDFKKNLKEFKIQEEAFWRVSTLPSRSHKLAFVFVNQIQHFKALNQNSLAHKIQLKILIDFKKNLQETQIQRERSWKVLTFASLSKKNGFVFVNQIWRFKNP